MSYLVELDKPCPDCGRRATHQLRNFRNEIMGDYCKRHAEKRHRDLSAREKGERP